MVRTLFLPVLLAVVLAGCFPEDTSVVRAVRSILSAGPGPLTDEAQQELEAFDATVASASEDRDAFVGALNHFRDALDQIRLAYVKEVDDRALIAAAREGLDQDLGDDEPDTPETLVSSALGQMLESLDPHSHYLDAEAFQDFQVSTRGEFGGLGIEITEEEELIKVISPIEDTPADRAGIAAGDLITHVDGQSIRGLGLRESVRLMRGPPGTSINLTLRRGSGQAFDVIIERAVIRVRPVRWRTEGNLGYIRIASFNEQVRPGLERAMSELREELGDQLAGLVIDLRNNPGGLLDQSVWVSDAFLDDGVIVETRGRLSGDHSVYRASHGDLARDLPILILINVGSASASEIVTSALQDAGRATVMGARSYGKGSVQTIFPLPRAGGLKLTTQLHYRPSGVSLQGLGVLPNVIVESAEPVEARREADQPGALPPDHAERMDDRVKISESACPEREDEDRILGCALLYLRSGQEQAFLANLGGRL